MADSEPKRCLGCGYILDHLPEPRCPECGRSFDPIDARTFRKGPRPLRWPHALVIAGILYPWIVMVALYATWLVAAGELGRFPRPNRDDPESIGPVTDVARSATIVLIMASPLSLGMLTVGLIGVVTRSGRTRGGLLGIASICFLASWAASCGLLRHSSVANWFMD